MTIVPTTAAATAVDGCDLETIETATVEMRAQLEDDGTVRDVVRDAVRDAVLSDPDGADCATSVAGDAVDLPVAVSVLHRTAADGGVRRTSSTRWTGP